MSDITPETHPYLYRRCDTCGRKVVLIYAAFRSCEECMRECMKKREKEQE
jgi:ribosomal protein S14